MAQVRLPMVQGRNCTAAEHQSTAPLDPRQATLLATQIKGRRSVLLPWQDTQERTEVQRGYMRLDLRLTDWPVRDTAVVHTWPLPVQPSVTSQLRKEDTLTVVPLDPPSMPFPRPPLVVMRTEARFRQEHMPVAEARTLVQPEATRVVCQLVSEVVVGPTSSLPVDQSASTLSAKALGKPVFLCMPSATAVVMVAAMVVRRPGSRGHR